MTDRAQVVVTTRTREGRHVSKVLPRPEADALHAVLARAAEDPENAGTVSFETFGPLAGTPGRITLTGEAVLAVETVYVSGQWKDTGEMQ